MAWSGKKGRFLPARRGVRRGWPLRALLLGWLLGAPLAAPAQDQGDHRMQEPALPTPAREAPGPALKASAASPAPPGAPTADVPGRIPPPTAPTARPGEHPLRLEPTLFSVVAPADISDGETPPQETVWAGLGVVAPGDQVFGPGERHYLVQGPESLVTLARAYRLGFNEVALANPGVDRWLPGAGRMVRLPFRWVLPRRGDPNAEVVINLPEMRLYHWRGGGRVDTYPVGIGKEGFDTPTGEARVLRKKAGPSWHVPPSIQAEDPTLPTVVPPGENNPLGSHALYLSLASYLIHGTNQPYGVGRRVSHGCIRLYPEDIPRLFQELPVGARVAIIHQPVKAGWLGNQLLLEVHPPVSDDPATSPGLGGETLHQAVWAALEERPRTRVELDWRLMERVVARADGIPVVVGRQLTPDGVRVARWSQQLGEVAANRHQQ